jgi:hypothetical protein
VPRRSAMRPPQFAAFSLSPVRSSEAPSGLVTG